MITQVETPTKISTGVAVPSYRLKSRQFTKDYGLGTLSYLSDRRSLRECEKDIFEMMLQEKIYPEGSGLFSITGQNGRIILIPTHCMQAIENSRYDILDCMDRFESELKYIDDPEPGHRFFDFVHPVADQKHLVIRGEVSKILDKQAVTKFRMYYEGIGHECDSILQYICDPVTTFSFAGFHSFLIGFFPCVGLYTSGLTVQNFDQTDCYIRMRQKINRNLYYDVLSYENSNLLNFKNDNDVVLMY